MTFSSADEAAILQKIISALNDLDEDGRERMLRTVATFYGVDRLNSAPEQSGASKPNATTGFSDHSDISAKDFMNEKRPKTDVERVACLAFYLTHYRDIPHFKTFDITKVNTEAAQHKFANASKTLANAMAYGYLAPGAKGTRQLSAAGEQFVLAMPDRTAAKEALAQLKPRRRNVIKSKAI